MANITIERLTTHEFLLTFSSNCGSILYSFRDPYFPQWSKISMFIPYLSLLGVSCQYFCIWSGRRTNGHLATVWTKLHM